METANLFEDWDIQRRDKRKESLSGGENFSMEGCLSCLSQVRETESGTEESLKPGNVC